MNYKQVIESKYNREAWQQLLHDIFLSKVTFYNRPATVRISSRMAKEAFNLGRISLSDGECEGGVWHRGHSRDPDGALFGVFGPQRRGEIVAFELSVSRGESGDRRVEHTESARDAHDDVIEVIGV